APDDDVDIERIEFEPKTTPPGAFGGHQGRAAAKKRIEDDVAPIRAVEQGVGDHRHRFDGRMEGGEFSFFASAAEAGSAGVGPDIGAVPAMPAKLDIVDVRPGSVLEDQDQLMLRPIKTAHAAIWLDPDAKI